MISLINVILFGILLVGINCDCSVPTTANSLQIIAQSRKVTYVEGGDTEGVIATISGAGCDKEGETLDYLCRCANEGGEIKFILNKPQLTIPTEIDADEFHVNGLTYKKDIKITTRKKLDMRNSKIHKIEDAGVVTLIGSDIYIASSTFNALMAEGTGIESKFTASLIYFTGAIEGYAVDYHLFKVRNFGNVEIKGAKCAEGDVNMPKWKDEVPSRLRNVILYGTVYPAEGTLLKPAGVLVQNWGDETCALDLIAVEAKTYATVQLKNIYSKWVPNVVIDGPGSITMSNVNLYSAVRTFYPTTSSQISVQGDVKMYGFTTETLAEGVAMGQVDFITIEGRGGDMNIMWNDMDMPHVLINHRDRKPTDTLMQLDNVKFNSFFPIMDDAPGTPGVENPTGAVVEVMGNLIWDWTNVKQLHSMPYSLPFKEGPVDIKSLNDNQLAILGSKWSSSFELRNREGLSLRSHLNITKVGTVKIFPAGEPTLPFNAISLTIDGCGIEGVEIADFKGTMVKVIHSTIWQNVHIYGQSNNIEFKYNRVIGGETIIITDRGTVDVDAIIDPLANPAYWISSLDGDMAIKPDNLGDLEGVTVLPSPDPNTILHFTGSLVSSINVPLESHDQVLALGVSAQVLPKPMVSYVSLKTMSGQAKVNVQTPQATRRQVYNPRVVEGGLRMLKFHSFDRVHVFSRMTYTTQGILDDIDNIMTKALTEPTIVVFTINPDPTATGARAVTVTDDDRTYRCTNGQSDYGSSLCVAHVIFPDTDPGVKENLFDLFVTSTIYSSFAPVSPLGNAVIQSATISMNGGCYKSVDSALVTIDRAKRELYYNIHDVIWETEFKIIGDPNNKALVSISMSSDALGMDRYNLKDEGGWTVSYLDNNKHMEGGEGTPTLLLQGKGNLYMAQHKGRSTFFKLPEGRVANVLHITPEKNKDRDEEPDYVYLVPVDNYDKVQIIVTGQTVVVDGEQKHQSVYVSSTRVSDETTFAATFSVRGGAIYIIYPTGAIESFIIGGRGVTYHSIKGHLNGFTNEYRALITHKLDADIVVSGSAIITDFLATRAQIHGSSTIGITPNAASYKIVREKAMVSYAASAHSKATFTDFFPSLYENVRSMSMYADNLSKDGMYPSVRCYSTTCHTDMLKVKDCVPTPEYFFCAGTTYTHDTNGETPTRELTLRGGFFTMFTRGYDKYVEPKPKMEAWKIALIVVNPVVVIALVVFLVWAICFADMFNRIFCSCCGNKQTAGKDPAMLFTVN